jgi:hypothetical protein
LPRACLKTPPRPCIAAPAKGAILRATEQPIDTSSAAGKAFLDILGVFAEFETNLRRERQMEGINAAKLKGVYKGRRVIVMWPFPDGHACFFLPVSCDFLPKSRQARRRKGDPLARQSTSLA